MVWTRQVLFGLKPFDLCRFESHGLMPHAKVVIANRAAVLVSQKNFGPKGGNTSALGILGCSHGFNLCQSLCIQHITTNTVGEMRIDNTLNHDADEFRIRLQCRIDSLGEATPNMLLSHPQGDSKFQGAHSIAKAH
jgi:hypothetical protein